MYVVVCSTSTAPVYVLFVVLESHSLRITALFAYRFTDDGGCSLERAVRYILEHCIGFPIVVPINSTFRIHAQLKMICSW